MSIRTSVILLSIKCIAFLSLLIAIPIERINNVQKVQTTAILEILSENNYSSEIKLIFPNDEFLFCKVDDLEKKLPTYSEVQKNYFLETKSALAPIILTSSSHKINKPKITLFDSNSGHRSITFACESIKLGKMRLGPFEIPSNKSLIKSPELKYHK